MAGFEIEFTDEFGQWFESLSEEDQDDVVAAVDVLEQMGPGARRPLVGVVEGGRHTDMRELVVAGNIRVFFVWDPRRVAILLIGGDKTNRWKAFYQETVPVADRLYEEHLKEIQEE